MTAPPPPPTDAPASPSLRTGLLAALALLTVVAVFMAALTVLVVPWLAGTPGGAFYLAALIAGLVGLFVLFGASQLRRLVLRPLAESAAAAEAIAAGELDRRMPAGASRELDLVAHAVNRMTERLLEERAQLVRAEKLASVGRLAAGVAHEIGNPLGAINGYLHLLRTRATPGAVPPEVMEGLERESDRIDRIVRGLLDYARPRRGSRALVDVAAIAREAATLLADQGRFRSVRLTLDLDDRGCGVAGDRTELEQLFVNLLLNAVDAVGPGREGEVSVHVRRIPREWVESGGSGVRRLADPPHRSHARRPDSRLARWLERVPPVAEIVKVIVADSGSGIPEADRERIFDPFYTTKEPGKGTGLGLAIVARTVENLGGTIWVTAAREGGAAFHLLLPLAIVSRGTPMSATAVAIPAASVR